MKWNPYTRRMFLQGAGNFALAIPFLPSLMPRAAWGDTAAPAKRFVAICNDYGISLHENWHPTNNLPNLTLNVAGHSPIHYQALKDFVPNANSSLTRPNTPAIGRTPTLVIR